MAVFPEELKVGLGLRIPRLMLERIRTAGLTISTAVGLRYQTKAQRWVLAASEQGGAAGNLAHYVGYVGVAPSGFLFSLPIHSLIPNGVHRRVAAQDLVRFEIVRYESSCDVFIARHYLHLSSDGGPSESRRQILFLGRHGAVTEKTDVPVFYDPNGERIEYPSYLLPGLRALARAAYSQDCGEPLMVVVPTIDPKDIPTPPRDQEIRRTLPGTPPGKSSNAVAMPQSSKKKKKKKKSPQGQAMNVNLSVPKNGTAGD